MAMTPSVPVGPIYTTDIIPSVGYDRGYERSRFREEGIMREKPIARAGHDTVVGERNITRDELLATGNLLEDSAVGYDRNRRYSRSSDFADRRYIGGDRDLGVGRYRDYEYDRYRRSDLNSRFNEPVHAPNAHLANERYVNRYGDAATAHTPDMYSRADRLIGRQHYAFIQ